MKSIQFKKRFNILNLCGLVSLSVSLLTVSCGAESKVKKCIVTLQKTGSQALQDGVEATYRGNLAGDCGDVIAKTGKASILLSISGQPVVGGYLKNLKAGTRSKAFGAGYSLESGSISSEFTSDDYKDWATPWTDKPTEAILTVQLPVGGADSALPAISQMEVAVAD